MSSLETFRDHCREMAAWQPKPRLLRGGWCRSATNGIETYEAVHENCGLKNCACECHPAEVGLSDADRALFARLADEVDAYLAGDDGQGALL